MYKVAYYNDVTHDQMIAFAKENYVAIVTGQGKEFPVATHLPLEIVEEDGKVFLKGHLMRKTDHHLAFEKNENVLTIFNSPSALISAKWYADPMSGSTINYMTVHAKGKIKFTDEAGTRAAVKRITDQRIGTGNAASFENLTEEYVSAMVKAIAGFCIEVENMEAVFKLSQNRSIEDQQVIINKLKERNEPGDMFIATQMEHLLP
jgi:transcriptional regulator